MLAPSAPDRSFRVAFCLLLRCELFEGTSRDFQETACCTAFESAYPDSDSCRDEPTRAVRALKDIEGRARLRRFTTRTCIFDGHGRSKRIARDLQKEPLFGPLCRLVRWRQSVGQKPGGGHFLFARTTWRNSAALFGFRIIGRNRANAK